MGGLMGPLMAVLLALLLNGCGYHLVGHGDGVGGAIPNDVQMLSLAGNAKPELLAQLRQRLQSDRYAIVDANGEEANKPENAASFVMLQVNMQPLIFTPSTFDASGIATQYRMIISGSLLLEQIFTLDGLGLLSYQAVIQRDYPIVLGTLFIFSLMALIGQLLTDLSYVLIDPRISFDESQG